MIKPGVEKMFLSFWFFGLKKAQRWIFVFWIFFRINFVLKASNQMAIIFIILFVFNLHEFTPSMPPNFTSVISYAELRVGVFSG